MHYYKFVPHNLINIYCLSVEFLADLYIHGETTFEIVDQGKMKTVAVNRTEYMLTPDAISEFKNNSRFMGAGYLREEPI